MNKGTNTGGTGAALATSFDEHDLVTCVHLNHKTYEAIDEDDKPKKKDVYHGIYVSQLYGTMFAIYGSFDIDKEEQCCHVKKIKLKLLNYKGLFNMGFHVNSKEAEVKTGQIEIEIPVRALSNIYEMDISLSQPIRVDKGGFVRVIFNRLLYPITGFGVDPGSQKNIDQLKSVKSSFNPSPHPTPTPTPIPDLPFFDTEFNYRDGVDYYDQLLLAGKSGYEKPEKGHPVFSHRCLQSNVNIAFF